MRRISGLPLLILIFVSLCLVTFSLLSVSESRADQTLGEKAAGRTTAYYEANTKANALLAQVDQQLAENLREADTAADHHEAYYYQLCGHITDTISNALWEETEHTISFSVPVTDHQELSVRLTINWPTQDTDTLYQIAEWKIKNTQDWTPDASMNLLRTNSEETEG